MCRTSGGMAAASCVKLSVLRLPLRDGAVCAATGCATCRSPATGCLITRALTSLRISAHASLSHCTTPHSGLLLGCFRSIRIYAALVAGCCLGPDAERAQPLPCIKQQGTTHGRRAYMLVRERRKRAVFLLSPVLSIRIATSPPAGSGWRPGPASASGAWRPVDAVLRGPCTACTRLGFGSCCDSLPPRCSCASCWDSAPSPLASAVLQITVMGSEVS